MDGAGADARTAGDLVERDAKAFRREQLLRGPQHPLAVAARVSAQLTVTSVSGCDVAGAGSGGWLDISTSITGAPHRLLLDVTGAAHRLRARAAHQDPIRRSRRDQPMTAREDASALVRRMQECLNTRQFDQAARAPGLAAGR